MDKNDHKILKELILNPLESRPRMAKRLSLSREVLSYRIKKMEREKIFEYWSVIDIFKVANIVHFWINIKHSLTALEEAELVSLLKGSPIFNLYLQLVGTYNTVISCILNQKDDIYTLISQIDARFKNKISSFSVPEIVEEHFFCGHFLGIDYTQHKYIIWEKKEVISLDPLDLKIIKTLFEYPLLNNIELAKQMKVSIDTTRSRVKKLYQEKVVMPYVEVDFQKFGYSAFMYFGNLKCLDSAMKKKIITYAQMHTCFLEVLFCVGEYNLILNLVVKDTTELRDSIVKFKSFIQETILTDNVLIILPERERGLRLHALFGKG